MQKVTVVLKSGARLEFRCSDVQINYHRSTAEVSGITMDDTVGERFLHIVPSQIAAVLVLKEEE